MKYPMTDEQFEKLGILIETKDYSQTMAEALDRILERNAYADIPPYGWNAVIQQMQTWGDLPLQYQP